MHFVPHHAFNGATRHPLLRYYRSRILLRSYIPHHTSQMSFSQWTSSLKGLLCVLLFVTAFIHFIIVKFYCSVKQNIRLQGKLVDQTLHRLNIFTALFNHLTSIHCGGNKAIGFVRNIRNTRC